MSGDKWYQEYLEERELVIALAEEKKTLIALLKRALNDYPEISRETRGLVEKEIAPKTIQKSRINFPTVEEMHCPCCKAVTGHSVKKEKWTCIHCDTPLI